jgi:hypothetical protein
MGLAQMLVSYPPLALKVLFRSFTDSKALRSLRKGKGRKGKGNSKGKATAKADSPPAAKDDNQKTRATAKKQKQGTAAAPAFGKAVGVEAPALAGR